MQCLRRIGGDGGGASSEEEASQQSRIQIDAEGVEAGVASQVEPKGRISMLLLIIILLLVFGGGGGYYGYGRWGSRGGAGIGLGTILIILLIAYMLGIFH